MQDGREKLCCSRGMSASALREESFDGRCGKTIEAKPLSDQTCLIEPAKDVAYADGSKGTR